MLGKEALRFAFLQGELCHLKAETDAKLDHVDAGAAIVVITSRDAELFCEFVVLFFEDFR